MKKLVQSLDKAQERLEQRHFAIDLTELAEKLGKEIHLELYDGDCGIYKGEVKLGKETYGLLKHNDSYTLLSQSMSQDLSINKQYEANINKDQELTIEAVKPEPTKQIEQQQTRGRTIERSIDFELSR